MTEWNNRNNQQDGKSGQTESGERYAGQQYANQPGQPSRSAGQYYGNPTGQQIQAAGQHYANPAGQQLQAAGQRYANPAGQQSQTIGQRYANGSVQHGDQRPQAFARPQVQGAPDLVRQQAQRMPDSAVQPGRTPAPGGSPASSRTPAPGGSSASFRTPAPDGTPSPGGMYSSGGTSASGRMPAPGGTSAPGRMPAPARNAAPGGTSAPGRMPAPGGTSAPGRMPAPGGTSAPGRMPAPARTPAAGRTPVPGRPSRADRRKMAPETQAIPDTSASVRRRKSEVIYGDALKEDVPRVPGRPMLFLKGNDGLGRHVQVPFTNDLLSRHLMLLGGIGTGKTNAFFQMIDQLQYSLTQDDIMVIFDTKGDFLQEFFREGDVVISNDKTAAGPDGKRNYWNIFNEINTKYEYESILEISKSLFAEACKNTTQIFFPNAARDLFMACMLHFRRTVPLREQTNKNLVGYINSSTSADLRKMVESYPDMRAMASYISKDDSAQTQGVLSELQQVIRNIFVGNFAKTGNLGLSRLVKAKQGRKIFIEYDLSLGEMLTPIYSLMFDMAIKQALGRSRSEGNVFFITDEFRLLPNLMHIDDAVNFGRSLGIKFMIGIQNVEQIFENYGEYRARSIMSGFLTSFNFRVNDAKSREYIKDQFGKNRKLEAYVPILQNKGMVEEQREANVVEDWDVSNLGIGQAIIGLPGYEPFLFQFDRFD